MHTQVGKSDYNPNQDILNDLSNANVSTQNLHQSFANTGMRKAKSSKHNRDSSQNSQVKGKSKEGLNLNLQEEGSPVT